MKDKKINRKFLATLKRQGKKATRWPLQSAGYSYEDWLEVYAAITEHDADPQAICDYLGNVRLDTLKHAVNSWKERGL